MAEWLKATDCKSVPARVRWFESTSAHIFYKANCDATRPMSKIKALSVRSAHAVAMSKRKVRNWTTRMKRIVMLFRHSE